LYGDSFCSGLSMLKTLTKTDSRQEAIAVTTSPKERKLMISTLVFRGICSPIRIASGTIETSASVMMVTLMVPKIYCAVFMQLPGMVRSQNFGIGRQFKSATRVPATPNMTLMVNNVQSDALIHMFCASSLIKVMIKDTLSKYRIVKYCDDEFPLCRASV
jgi:hypothetical protein